ncbi:DUF2167 domain-containing protein [Alteromonas sp. A079]|uniref:DUF2167 domain-containing protein n=1 Tax=Alteromonas sp. A079 TaxID=3410268 RepID=UPI003BA0AE7F
MNTIKYCLCVGVALYFSSSIFANALAVDLPNPQEALQTENTAIEEVGLSEEAIAQQKFEKWAQEFEASLTYETGEIALPGGKATLTVPEDYFYLSPADTKRVLEDAWGNPEGEAMLGMLFPTKYQVLDNASWGVTIEYADDGYVSDDNVEDIDYADLLAEMKSDVQEESQWREEEGYPSIALIGWAEKPYYDKGTHKLYWAKEIKFGESQQNTLNYNVRALGRQGYLVMNFIASMDQLDEVNAARDEVLAMVQFNDGHKYSQFNPDIDDVAAYGIGGLIAGKVLAKTGLFAVALVFLKKFWFVLFLPLVWLKKKFFPAKDTSAS